MEHKTIAGNYYTITSKSGCSVTDSTGTLSMTVDAGGQLTVQAPSDKLVYDDEQAIVFKANFKQAALALGLLGGGKTDLPAGYTRVEFLQNTGKQYINTGWKATPNTGCRLNVQAETSTAFCIPCGEAEGFVPLLAYKRIVGYATASGQYPLKDGTVITNGNSAEATGLGYINEGRITAELNFLGSGRWRYRDAVNSVDIPAVGLKSTAYPLYLTARNYQNHTQGGSYFYYWTTPFYRAQFSEGRKLTHDYQPALNEAGLPCLYDSVTQTTLTNLGSGQYIAGMTLVQARKLSKLPAGTILTVSLPVGYDADDGVVAALTQAEANGCVLTIQTYEAAGAAAATFALRRVWVRRQQDSSGTYVDADGSRWMVDWCVDVIGADPESLGYERYRSVDAAVAYWGLTPYECPEEELSNAE